MAESGPARGELHPDHRAQGEGGNARSDLAHPRRRNRLSVPGRRTVADRFAAEIAAWLRNYRATGGGAGCPGVARPTLGFDFFLPGRPLLHKIAESGAVPGHGRVRGTAQRGQRGSRNGARTITEARRILLQPAAESARAHWTRGAAWTETPSFSHRPR